VSIAFRPLTQSELDRLAEIDATENCTLVSSVTDGARATGATRVYVSACPSKSAVGLYALPCVRKGPIARASMSVFRKHEHASCGEHTIGSP
jgi:hypothetical protein